MQRSQGQLNQKIFQQKYCSYNIFLFSDKKKVFRESQHKQKELFHKFNEITNKVMLNV